MAQVISQRLRDGRPLWHEQLAFRLAGLGGLWGFALFARWLFWLQQRAPAVAGRPCMLAGCLVAVAVLQAGLALALAGPGLLRQVPWPGIRRIEPGTRRIGPGGPSPLHRPGPHA
ncbi:MAG TPA: hypothetical protein VFF98_14400 [Novosphingobium sp.]|nr:hypothetical protein [Novosphingobium sp.]